jgi:hypothetical protein
MKIFIHIGLAKAASTSLQYLLKHTRDDLLVQGAFVPLIGFRRDPFSESGKTDGHDILSLLALNRAKLVRFFDQIIQQAEAAGCHCIILSSENLSHPANLPDLPQFVQGLQEAFVNTKRAEISYIVFNRKDENWLRSLYNERVTDGRSFETRSFAQFALDMATKNISAPLVIDKCRRIIGDALTVTAPIDGSARPALEELASLGQVAFNQDNFVRQRTSPTADLIEQRRIQNSQQISRLPMLFLKNPVLASRALQARFSGESSSFLRRTYRRLEVRFFTTW